MIDTPIVKHPAATQGLKRSPVSEDKDYVMQNSTSAWLEYTKLETLCIRKSLLL